jgi:small-conductance mechanosensitive channel
MLEDLDRRNADVAAQEEQARKVLEEALAQCAAVRASIDEQRGLLTQVGQLYQQFLETHADAVPEISAIAPAPVPVAPPPPPPPAFQVRPQPEKLALVDSDVESEIAITIRDLRSHLIAEQRGTRVA